MGSAQDEAGDRPWASWRPGDRVVVRYRRGAPAAGEPPLSDALGEVVASGPDGITVRTRRGDVVVPGDAVVLGKRVPPPPPPRHT
jgi:hypothetical protein